MSIVYVLKKEGVKNVENISITNYLISNNAKSIYNILCDNISSDEVLPGDFCLPPECDVQDTSRANLGYTKRATGRVVDRIVKLLKSDQIKHSYSQNEIAKLLKAQNVHFIIQMVIQRFRRSIKETDITGYASKLAFESTDADLVQLGISLFTFVDLSTKKEIVDKLLVLALYEIFTSYVVGVISEVEGINDKLFVIAKKSNITVKNDIIWILQPTSDEIREWMLRKGFKDIPYFDSVDGARFAKSCNILQILRYDTLDDELFDGMNILIHGLIGNGYINDSISSDGHLDEVLKLFLKHAIKQAVTLEHLWTIEDIHYNLKNGYILCSSPESKEEIEALCKDILSKPHWHDVVCEALENPDCNEDNYFLVVKTAWKLDLDVFAQLYKLIKLNPMKYFSYLHYFHEAPLYTAKIVDIYEASLPLDDMATGFGYQEIPTSLYNEEYWCLQSLLQLISKNPGVGIRFVFTALCSPIVFIRRTAYRVLQEWTNRTGGSIESLYPELFSAIADNAPRENDSDIKTIIKELDRKLCINYKFHLLTLAQIVLFAVAFYFIYYAWGTAGERLLSGAYSALDILNGYLAWYRLIFHLSWFLCVVVVVGNFILLNYAFNKKIAGVRHLCTALAAIIAIIIIAVMANRGISVQGVRDDISSFRAHERAVEIRESSWNDPARLAHDVATRRFDVVPLRLVGLSISLDEVSEQLRQSPDLFYGEHPSAIYSVTFDFEPYTVFFPRELVDEMLRELDGNGLVMGDMHTIEVWYTPTLLVVGEVKLLR